MKTKQLLMAMALILTTQSIGWSMASPNRPPRGSCQCIAAVTQNQKGRTVKMGDKIKIPNLTETQCKMHNGATAFGYPQGGTENTDDPVLVHDCLWSMYLQQ